MLHQPRKVTVTKVVAGIAKAVAAAPLVAFLPTVAVLWLSKFLHEWRHGKAKKEDHEINDKEARSWLNEAESFDRF